MAQRVEDVESAHFWAPEMAASGASARVDCVEVVLPHCIMKPNHSGVQRLMEAASWSGMLTPDEYVDWFSPALNPRPCVSHRSIPGRRAAKAAACLVDGLLLTSPCVNNETM